MRRQKSNQIKEKQQIKVICDLHSFCNRAAFFLSFFVIKVTVITIPQR